MLSMTTLLKGLPLLLRGVALTLSEPGVSSGKIL